MLEHFPALKSSLLPVRFANGKHRFTTSMIITVLTICMIWWGVIQVSSADALAGDILGDSARTGGKSTSSLLNRTALGPFDQNLVTVFVLGEVSALLI